MKSTCRDRTEAPSSPYIISPSEKPVCKSSKMSIFFILIFFPLVGVAADDCEPAKCAKHGPSVRFPFRLKNKHPPHCGHPGFDLYCDRKHTLFPLSSSVNLSVEKIDYKSQLLHLSDPQRCLIGTLIPDLNLSASPFNYSSDNYIDDYILFNCSSRRDLSYAVPCLSDSANKCYAVLHKSNMDSLSLASCTSVNTVSSVPWEVLDKNVLRLNWSEPACASCEAQGRRCSVQKNTSGFQCVSIPTDKGASRKATVIAAGSILAVVTAVALILVCKLIITGREHQKKIEKFLEDYKAVKPTRFCYSDLRRITNQFSEKLGEGGYGIVYKGKLTSEISVAVKVLNNSKENGEEFVNEVSTIGRIHHINVVRLVGFCAEGFRRVLVYEFLPNDSLEKFIFQTESNRISLGWQKLEEIALGIAKGIEYLHQGCDQQILHFDIKPHNILLDHNLSPKISDFGLAKLCSKEQSGVTMTAARGTMGYIAPEVLSRTFGKVSYKSDVYSFGMLLLEMVGGRKNVDPKVNTSQIYFPEWVYSHLNLGEEFWAEIEGGEHGDVARKLAIVGLSCIHWHPTDRPSMNLVVQMLEGDGADLIMPPNPFPDPNFVQRQYQAELPLIPETDEQ